MRLVTELLKIESQNQYTLIIHPHAQQHIQDELSNQDLPKLQLVTCNARHYSVSEQIQLPKLLHQIKPDILHVPHFNIPILYTGPLVVTIHDLIKQSSVGAQTTTLPMPIYWFKYAVHNQVIAQAIHRSKAVIVPSQFTKDQIIKSYPGVGDSKIHITYEAPDPIYFKPNSKRTNFKPTNIPFPYLIYTGNAYPHKNILNLLQAIKQHNTNSDQPLHIAIVCARNVFQSRLEAHVNELNLDDTVHFLGFVPDEQLRDIYRNAHAFITPSLIEGFGLPGLEALAAGTLVLSSNLSSMPEIYTDNATYFDPKDPLDIAKKINQTLNFNKSERQKIIQNGIKYAQRFSWGKMAKQTLDVYDQIYEQ